MTCEGVLHLSSQEPEWQVPPVEEKYTVGVHPAVAGDESETTEDCIQLRRPTPRQRPREADADLPVSLSANLLYCCCSPGWHCHLLLRLTSAVTQYGRTLPRLHHVQGVP